MIKNRYYLTYVFINFLQKIMSINYKFRRHVNNSIFAARKKLENDRQYVFEILINYIGV